MLKTNLSRQSLSAFANIYVCLLQCLITREGCHIIRWAILRGACTMKVNASYIVRALKMDVSSWKSPSLLTAISAYYTTLLSNRIASIWNFVPSFVLAPSRQMRIMGKGKRFFWLASSCTFDLCTDLHCNNCPTFYYLPFFVKMLPHFELKMSNYRSFLIEGFKLQVGSS